MQDMGVEIPGAVERIDRTRDNLSADRGGPLTVSSSLAELEV